MRNFVGSLCVVVALSVSAQATTVWTGTNVRVDASAPVHVGIALEAVTLTAIGMGGGIPNAFDGVGTTGDLHDGITTVGNGLHQVWEANVLQTPTLDVSIPADAAFQPIDTHFLMLSGDLAVTHSPSENRNVTYTVENPNGGFGNQLTGTFSLTNTSPPSTWDFAYIVAPVGTVVGTRLLSGWKNFSKELATGSFSIVPEPPSVIFLIAGAIGLAVIRLVVPRPRSLTSRTIARRPRAPAKTPANRGILAT